MALPHSSLGNRARIHLKTKQNNVGENVNKLERLCPVGEMLNGAETVWWFLKLLKIELSHDPAISLPVIYPKELKAGSQDMCTLMFTAGLSRTAKR